MKLYKVYFILKGKLDSAWVHALDSKSAVKQVKARFPGASTNYRE